MNGNANLRLRHACNITLIIATSVVATFDVKDDRRSQDGIVRHSCEDDSELFNGIADAPRSCCNTCSISPLGVLERIYFATAAAVGFELADPV
jgi:hypothetical protein